MSTPQLIVALDYAEADLALALARQIAPLRPWMKVGLELLMHAGPQVVRDLRGLGLPVFLDGKFHDIPNTVAGAVRGATVTGANIINVHASGGVRMMQAARKAAEETAAEANIPRPLVIAVTVLTSLAPEELRDEVGCSRSPEEQVVALALRAKEAGLDGVVASVWETAAIKAACGSDFKVITPGIRPTQGTTDDQRRVATPQAAIEAGSDFLVVGRPITQAEDPAAACAAILASIQH
ncbi:MAG TPA: orotidine-5'-phosphate decarboxylase [Armatimonadota bacterium]|nr:orotidine-5'-phosphate decarboxylase [Armatimonadota bacterium]